VSIHCSGTTRTPLRVVRIPRRGRPQVRGVPHPYTAHRSHRTLPGYDLHSTCTPPEPTTQAGYRRPACSEWTKSWCLPCCGWGCKNLVELGMKQSRITELIPQSASKSCETTRTRWSLMYWLARVHICHQARLGNPIGIKVSLLSGPRMSWGCWVCQTLPDMIQLCRQNGAAYQIVPIHTWQNPILLWSFSTWGIWCFVRERNWLCLQSGGHCHSRMMKVLWRMSQRWRWRRQSGVNRNLKLCKY